MALRLAGRRRGRGLHRLAEGGEHRGVDGIALGVLGPGLREVACPCRRDDAHEPAGFVQCGHQRGFVTASGFEDDLDAGVRRCSLLGLGQQPQDAGMAFGRVLQGVGNSAQVELKCGLGNVQAGVEDGVVVRTHACKMRASARCRPRIAQSTLRVWINGGKGRGLLDASRHPRGLTQRWSMPAARAPPLSHRRAGCKPRGGLVFLPPVFTGSPTSNPDIQAATECRLSSWVASSQASAPGSFDPRTPLVTPPQTKNGALNPAHPIPAAARAGQGCPPH